MTAPSQPPADSPRRASGLSDDERVPSHVSQADIDWIEQEVGMGAGAWDMVDPGEIIAACWRRLRVLAAVPLPENPICPNCGRTEREHDGTAKNECIVLWGIEPVESWRWRNEQAKTNSAPPVPLPEGAGEPTVREQHTGFVSALHCQACSEYANEMAHEERVRRTAQKPETHHG